MCVARKQMFFISFLLLFLSMAWAMFRWTVRKKWNYLVNCNLYCDDFRRKPKQKLEHCFSRCIELLSWMNLISIHCNSNVDLEKNTKYISNQCKCFIPIVHFSDFLMHHTVCEIHFNIANSSQCLFVEISVYTAFNIQFSLSTSF